MAGAQRPAAVAGLALPPDPMPAFLHGRPLKAWRYVAFLSPDLIACVARVRIGLLRDSFWAIWERASGLFWRGRRVITIGEDHASVSTPRVALQLQFTPGPGVETVSPSGSLYGWTCKRAPLPAFAVLRRGSSARRCAGRAVIDDTAAYYERHTRWFWSAGVAQSAAGESLAWNLVSGVNDTDYNSERTIWIDGVAHEPPRVAFADDLSAIESLRFSAEAELHRRTRLGPLRSDYRQPMGTFAGRLPGGIEVCDGLGVMERHDAWW